MDDLDPGWPDHTPHQLNFERKGGWGSGFSVLKSLQIYSNMQQI